MYNIKVSRNTDTGEVIAQINGKTITPEKSLALVNHSPDGFEFGYGGSGPSQLALAILLEIVESQVIAVKCYQKFKWDFIANKSQVDSFELNFSQKEINELIYDNCSIEA